MNDDCISSNIFDEGVAIDTSDSDNFSVCFLSFVEGINEGLSIVASDISVNDDVLAIWLKGLDLLFTDVHLFIYLQTLFYNLKFTFFILFDFIFFVNFTKKKLLWLNKKKYKKNTLNH